MVLPRGQNGRAVKALPYKASMETLPERKYIRLPLEAYANPASTFFVTIDAVSRQRFFDKPDFNNLVIARLKWLAVEKRCRVGIYCLMPTHLHLLISAGTISVVRWIALFKQYTQYIASQNGVPKLWQRSFIDHRLRPSEREADTIEYIRANPVRAALVEHPDDWPWTGSVVL